MASASPAGSGEFRLKLSLDGDWESRPHDGLEFVFPPPPEGWETEAVPHQAARQITSLRGPHRTAAGLFVDETGEGFVNDKMACWFRRTFKVPADSLRDRRVFLNLGAAHHHKVWINGHLAGESKLGILPARYDITAALTPGENSITIALAGREALLDAGRKSFLYPSTGVASGIWGEVSIAFVPVERIDDVYIRTPLSKGLWEADVEVVNQGGESARFTVEARISADNGALLHRFVSDPGTVPPGENRVFPMAADWVAERLWSPDSPYLHRAEFFLYRDGALADKVEHRFGYREFEIRGRDFFLNGRRILLRRQSTLYSLSEPPAELWRRMIHERGAGVNTVRPHIGFTPRAQIEAADQLGIMMMPESALHNIVGKLDLEKADEWIPNYAEYIERWIRGLRNHPSIIVWTLANETLWGETDELRMRVADAMVTAARKADPHRPLDGDAEVSWGGRLDILNIHYPESVVGPVRNQYPNSGFVVPNDFYWLRKDSENVAWRARFLWDRPLILGEYWWTAGEVDHRSSFMGEAAFDWRRWRLRPFGGAHRFSHAVDPDMDNPYFQTLVRMTDAYRVQGVAGLNPWNPGQEQTMPAVAVRPLDFHPNFAAGAAASRKLVIFNDTDVRSYHRLHLLSVLKIGDHVVWWQETPVSVSAGETRELNLDIKVPDTSEVTRARLEVQMRFWAAGGFHTLSTFEEDLFLVPGPKGSELPPDDIFLLDDSGRTEAALAKIGLNLPASPEVDREALAGKKVLILGDQLRNPPPGALIRDFAGGGGRVIVLSQNLAGPIAPGMPEHDPGHAASQAWIRNYDHPLLDGLHDGQFSFWRPGHLIGVRNFHKPYEGNFHILLDSGGRYGMEWSPLVEMRLGRGTVVLSQLPIIGAIDDEPMAGLMLERLVNYALEFESSEGELTLLLAGGERRESLSRILDQAGVDYTLDRSEIRNAGLILLDASHRPDAVETAALQAHLDRGGRLWVKGFGTGTDHQDTLSSLLPFQAVFAGTDQTVQSAARRSRHPLMNNLSSHDFFWTSVDTGVRRDYFERGRPTAPIGSSALVKPGVDSGEPLLDPGFLVRVPAGAGEILVDTLEWEGAWTVEHRKVLRYVSAITRSLGGRITEPSRDSTPYSHTHIALTEHVNTGYHGENAWTGGEADMRYFLINHTGVHSSGVEVGVPEFPTLKRFADIPFRLVDPAANDNRAVLAFRGGERLPHHPEKIEGIRVDALCDRLWFLHTAAWVRSEVGTEIARYLVHYADGTSVDIPIRRGLEVDDWWTPRPLPNARIGWTGRNNVTSPVGIYVARWDNPKPEVAIERIDVIANLDTSIYLLLGITAGRRVAEHEPVERFGWKFDRLLDDGRVPPFAGDFELSAVDGASPEAVEIDEVPGLRFRNAELRTAGGPVNLFGAGKTEIRLVFQAGEEPVGYYGGIMQAMDFHKGGVRILVRKKDLRLVAEYAVGPDERRQLVSNQPMIPGRTYTVTLSFDGKASRMLIDGAISAVSHSPGPAPYRGPIRFGRASGTDYNFNGVLFQASIAEIRPE